MSIEFRVLGPLEIRVDGRSVLLGGRKQRTLLALLLLSAGEVVPVERIVDELWEMPPASAAQSVQMHVSRLRRVLGTASDGGLIVTRPAGYVLAVAPDQLDLCRFERLVERGRAGARARDPSGARAAFAEALGLWRGDPLGGVADGPVLAAEAARLEELRLSVQLARVECDLALGRHAEVVGDLEALAQRHPLQERVRELLMLALYRCGRHAEALAVYQQMRRHLVEELGLEPSRDLQELQQRILRHDASLVAEPAIYVEPDGGVETRPPPGPATAARSDARDGRPRRRTLAVAGCAVALAAVGGLALLGLPTSEPDLGRIDADAVGVIDPASGRITRQLSTGGRPVGVAATRDAVWLADGDAGALVRIDPREVRALDTVPIAAGTTAVAAGAGSVWAISSDTRTLAQVNTATNTVVRRVRVGNGARALAVGAGAVWVANSLDGTVSVIDPVAGRTMTRVPVGGLPSGVAVGPGAIWVSNEADGTVTRIDPRQRAPVATIRVGTAPTGIAAGAGGVWVANTLDGTVSRIDPEQNIVTATTRVGAGATTVATAAGEIWVGVAGRGTVSRIEPRTAEVTRTFEVGGAPISLTGADGRLWAAVQAPASTHRGGTLVMTGADPTNSNSLDPAMAYSDRSFALLAVVTDGLVGHHRAGGAAGAALVADLADAVPGATEGGLTYRFRLRSGLRYSTGAPVRAHDVRASIERLHRMRALTLGSFPLGLHGDDRCTARRCDLSAGIATDDATGTVTFHLRRPNRDFLTNLATPTYGLLPAGAPPHDLTGPDLIGTGPYRVAGATPRREVTLARNLRFRRWSTAAQPDGLPDRIVWRLTVPGDRRATRTADIAMDPNPEEGERLLVRAPDRLRSEPISLVEYLWLNTRAEPFDRLDARRALAYAVDRRTLLRVQRPRSLAARRPTCQLLSPGFPGYEPYCPFTSRPYAASAGGAVPDLERARTLVRRSGTSGMRVSFFAPADNPVVMTLGRSVVRLLRRIGYRARLNDRHASRHGEPQRRYHAWTQDPANRAQIGWSLWIGDTPMASNVIPPLLSCWALRARGDALANNQAQFCDRRLEALMERAHALEATEPAAANRLWSGIDHALVRRAAIVPLFSVNGVQVTSARLGNYQYHPRLGPLLAQAWVR